MAQVKITIGQIEVALEDEEADFGPLADRAESITYGLIARAEMALEEDDEEDEDG